ncbi:MAG: hypothetical protein U0520_03970 [Candidatus Saccharimonadales bacterium]
MENKIDFLKSAEGYHRSTASKELKDAAGELVLAGFTGATALYGICTGRLGLFFTGLGVGVFAGKFGWEDAQSALSEASRAQQFKELLTQEHTKLEDEA